jgi:alpha-tubulin suppressor-like RCC1 family protein
LETDTQVKGERMHATSRPSLFVLALLPVPACLLWSACGGSVGASADAGAEAGGSSGSSSGSDSGSESATGSGGRARATAIAAGQDHTCALLSGGTVECWGYNTEGELGDGTSTGPETCVALQTKFACSTTPLVVSGLTGVTAIAAGGEHTCALLSGGTVECWGSSASGELGDGTSTYSSKPVAVSGLSGVTAIAAGYANTCALLSGGTVECWGDNAAGELGGGTATGPQTCLGSACSTTPVVVPGLTGVTAIAVGWWQVCALLSTGTVECWGDNEFGELGDGTHTGGPEACTVGACSATPVAVSNLGGVTAIAGGWDHTCALLSGGTIECWGSNSAGQLGDGTSTGPQSCHSNDDEPCSTTPVAVSGLSGVSAVAAGEEQTCALLSGGTVECWGGTYDGELGNGTSGAMSQTTPVAVSGLSEVTAITAGGGYTCALLSGGTVECWGYNSFGELGDGTSAGPQTCNGDACATTPVEVSGL